MIYDLIRYFQTFSPSNVIFAGAGVLLLVTIVLDHPYLDYSETEPTQTAKGDISSQDELIDLFERIGNLFMRLETYAEVSMTEAMKDIMVTITVEVVRIFAIVTRELKQGRTSGFDPQYSVSQR